MKWITYYFDDQLIISVIFKSKDVKQLVKLFQCVFVIYNDK